MVDRVKNIRNTLLSVAVVIGSVEYFKIWTRDHYDSIHCRTVIEDEDGIFKIEAFGTTSCDLEAQTKQVSKKLKKLEGDYHYCVNEGDKIIGYYSDGNGVLKLHDVCIGDVMLL